MFTGTFASQTHVLDEVKDETSLFLMRLRSRCIERGINYRYSVFPERHKSGAWHIHALIHGSHARSYIRQIDLSWQAGFSNVKICDSRAAGYVTKYVSKDLFDEETETRPRIRASRAPTYGAWVMQKDREVLKELMQAKPNERTVETWQKNLKMMVRQLEAKQSPERRLLEILTYGANKEMERV